MVGVSNQAVSDAVKDGRIVRGFVEEGGKKYIIPKVANAEWGKEFVNDVPGTDLELMTKASQAKQMESILKTQKLQLEVDQLKGILVKKDEVYRSLYAMGVEIRSALQAVPDRTIDEILAAKSRHAAKKILDDAIEAALLGLTEMQKRDIHG